MEFKEWLESVSQDVISKFTQMASRHLGGAENVQFDTNYSGQYTVSADYPQWNRTIYGALDDKGGRPYFIINFDWINDESGDDGMSNSGSVASGTMDFMRRLKMFVSDLQKIGIGIGYHPLGAGDQPKSRANFYDRHLQQSGFERSGRQNDPEQRWFPKMKP